MGQSAAEPDEQVDEQVTDVVPPRLAAAVEQARAAAVEAADGEASEVGEHVDVLAEDVPEAATHYFAATKPGYRGWYWAATLAVGDDDGAVGVSEVVLLPGPGSVVAPAWLPWQERVRAEDLGPGDLLPVDDDDERLVPAHAAVPDVEAPPHVDDPQESVVGEQLALGRPRVMSREGRLDAALRWFDGDFGPGAAMARAASAHCGTCGFYLPVAGSLQAAFGVCGNGNVPADGHVVHAEHGCGGHSELLLDRGATVAIADVVYDDGVEMEAALHPAPAADAGADADTPADPTPAGAGSPA